MSTTSAVAEVLTSASMPSYEVIPLQSVRAQIDSAPQETLLLEATNSSNQSAGDAMSVLVEPTMIYSDLISNHTVRAVLITVHVLISLVAIAGNGLVLFVIYKKRSLRKSPTVLFILNLALCDLVSCLLYRPLLLVELFLPFNDHFTTYPYHIQQCRAASFLQALFAAVGFLTIVAISQERLLLIVFPLKAKKFCSSGATKKVLVVIWVVAIATALPIPIQFCEIITISLTTGVSISLCGYFEGEPGAVIYFWFTFVFYFVLPLIILSVTYAKIFHALYRRSEQLDVNRDAGGGKSMKVRRSLAKMMVSVAIVFALCWGPDNLYFLYISCGGTIPSNGFFWAIFVELLPIISSGINPFVYTLNSRTFRAAFKSLLTKKGHERGEFSIGRSFYGPGTFHKSSMQQQCHSPSLSRNTFGLVDSPTLLRNNKEACLYCLRMGYVMPSPHVRRSFPQNGAASLSSSPRGSMIKRQWSCPEHMSDLRLTRKSAACTCGRSPRHNGSGGGGGLLKQTPPHQRMSLESIRNGSYGGGGAGAATLGVVKRNWAPTCPSPLLEADEAFFSSSCNGGGGTVGRANGDSKNITAASSGGDSSQKTETPREGKTAQLIGTRLKGDVLL